MPRQQRLEQSLPVVECCRLETLERCCEIDQAAAGRKIEHAQRAGDSKAAAAGDADTFAIVHKHQLGLDGQRERYRRALALVELRHGNIVGACMSRPHVKPAWRTRDPVAVGLRRFGVGEFIPHHCGTSTRSNSFGSSSMSPVRTR